MFYKDMSDFLVLMLCLLIVGGLYAIGIPWQYNRRDNLPQPFIAALLAFLATVLVTVLWETFLVAREAPPIRDPYDYGYDYDSYIPNPSLWSGTVAPAALGVAFSVILAGMLFTSTRGRRWWIRTTVALGGISLSATSICIFAWTISEGMHITASLQDIVEEAWWWSRFASMSTLLLFLAATVTTLAIALLASVGHKRRRKQDSQRRH